MNALYRFPIVLTLRGPILTKSTSPASFGLDAAVARDFESGRPMLPGTLVEGKVREALFQIGEAGRLDEFFGRSTQEDTGNEPARGKLLIGDLIAKRERTIPVDAGHEADEEQPVIATLSRVALDSTLGSAKGEMLRVIETPFLAGDEVEFVGSAEMFCRDEAAAKEIARLLRLGLSWLVQMGANRTTGFGRLLKVAVGFEEVDVEPGAITAALAATDLEIVPLGPLCIARHKIGDNLFESDDVIPGNVLAGAIMETAKALGIEKELADFDKIRFRHAFPATGDTRPGPIPHSTVQAGKPSAPGEIDHVFDIGNQPSPCLVMDLQGQAVAPEFPIDWKQHGDALESLGWAFPARELRVRTAIDSTSRTAFRGQDGEGGKLFAWEMVHPTDDGGKAIVWRSRIDLGGVDEERRQSTASALAKALAHLSFVSKTKARCRVVVTPVPQPDESPELKNDDKLTLVLRTPALLADPRFQKVADVPKSGALSAAGMLALYHAAFWEISGESLALSHHFARQFLAGGNYLAHRFQKKNQPTGPYDPWLLTDGGSVFVFTIKNGGVAEQKLAAWFATGLPLPQWAIDRFGICWTRNPYRPANGFGEVAIHQPVFAVPETTSVALADPILPTRP